MSSEIQLDVRTTYSGGAIWWTLTKERQVWCNLQVKLCDPCLSALRWFVYHARRYTSALLLLYMPIRKASSVSKTHIKLKLSEFCIFFNVLYKIWLPCVFSSRTFRISKFTIWLKLCFEICAKMICDLGVWFEIRFVIWHRNLIWNLPITASLKLMYVSPVHHFTWCPIT